MYDSDQKVNNRKMGCKGSAYLCLQGSILSQISCQDLQQLSDMNISRNEPLSSFSCVGDLKIHTSYNLGIPFERSKLGFSNTSGKHKQ
jgi:hypothetical protein